MNFGMLLVDSDPVGVYRSFASGSGSFESNSLLSVALHFEFRDRGSGYFQHFGWMLAHCLDPLPILSVVAMDLPTDLLDPSDGSFGRLSLVSIDTSYCRRLGLVVYRRL